MTVRVGDPVSAMPGCVPMTVEGEKRFKRTAGRICHPSTHPQPCEEGSLPPPGVHLPSCLLLREPCGRSQDLWAHTQFSCPVAFLWNFPGGPVVKNLPANARDTGPGRSHMPRGLGLLAPALLALLHRAPPPRRLECGLAGYSPWGRKDSDILC